MEGRRVSAKPAIALPRRPVKIRIRHLIKRFRSITAIEDVSLDIEEGTFFAIVGPSGCGKTTLLRILGGLEEVTSGEVEIADPAPGRPKYSMVFQGDSIFPWMTVRENAAYGLRMRKAPTAVIDRAVTRYLDRTGLTRFSHLYPHQLSGGMRQRVSIARALLGGPRLLLMDEPFGALDEITRDRLNAELRRIWAETGTTILFVTHSVYEAVFLAEQVLVLSANPGRVAALESIELPRDRDLSIRDTADFVAITARLRAHLGSVH